MQLLSPHVYSPTRTPNESWFPPVVSAFTHPARTDQPRSVLAVGTGSGLDMLAAVEICEPDIVDVTEPCEDSVDNLCHHSPCQCHDGCFVGGCPAGDVRRRQWDDRHRSLRPH